MNTKRYGPYNPIRGSADKNITICNETAAAFWGEKTVDGDPVSTRMTQGHRDQWIITWLLLNVDEKLSHVSKQSNYGRWCKPRRSEQDKGLSTRRRDNEDEEHWRKRGEAKREMHNWTPTKNGREKTVKMADNSCVSALSWSSNWDFRFNAEWWLIVAV